MLNITTILAWDLEVGKYEAEGEDSNYCQQHELDECGSLICTNGRENEREEGRHVCHRRAVGQREVEDAGEAEEYGANSPKDLIYQLASLALSDRVPHDVLQVAIDPDDVDEEADPSSQL